MAKPTDPGAEPAPHAAHGYRNEVHWDGGKGRQPYSNQGETEESPPAAAAEVEGGDRGAHSGQAVDQLAAAKGKPGG